MIYLSLDSINKQDVYYVMISPQGGYIFETGKGIHYTISFEEESQVGGCDTFQFVIEKRESVRSAHDPKVEKTILAILNQFFQEHLDVLLYMCDDSDRRCASGLQLWSHC